MVQPIYASGGPNVAQAACLEPAIATFVTGPNSISGEAVIYNGCPANVTGSYTLGARITDCPGVGLGDSSRNIDFQIPVEGSSITNFEVNAGCVICVDGEPLEYPGFHVASTESNIMGVF
jgi:hypothetical protein